LPLKIFLNFSLIFLAIKFSFCPEYPRMVMHFDYQGSQKETLLKIRSILEQNGFKILEYAPEDGFLFTDYKEFNWGTGRRLLAVAVHINDKVKLTGMGKMDIPITDLGEPEDLLEIKDVDRLPYNIQKKTFFTLVEPFEEIGLKLINN
tara:strand:+ start:586 stop:1029 length:444 start_codon:yes stop_codon:yes gene_type:complete